MAPIVIRVKPRYPRIFNSACYPREATLSAHPQTRLSAPPPFRIQSSYATAVSSHASWSGQTTQSVQTFSGKRSLSVTWKPSRSKNDTARVSAKTVG